jgi:ATP-dependent DNA helicase RecQ
MRYGLQDVILLRQMNEQSEADEAHKRIIRHKLEAMLGLCELTTCRRQALLAYFGETLAAPCGNCDNCLSPPQTWDATEAAQKALSCVWRTGQRFGVNYLVDVLLGKEEERIRRFGHHRLSTFGIGDELKPGEWRGLFRQLIARGYLEVDHEGHGALKLTENCRPLLRGEQRLELRRQRKPERRQAARKSRPAIPEFDASDNALFERLRHLRMELARAQGVPPYIIFSDATLREMVVMQPRTLKEMREVNGVGEQKLERYGQAFLAAIGEMSA